MKSKRQPTPFESSVYAVVRRIPRGRTRSYRWVAQQLGDAGLARAVGNALNRNPFAPEVPCHRVIRSDGSIGGFARGSSRKLALLRREGVILRDVCEPSGASGILAMVPPEE
jgi:methylated-DNA-[protein]-cysteine S-methyltransferase